MRGYDDAVSLMGYIQDRIEECGGFTMETAQGEVNVSYRVNCPGLWRMWQGRDESAVTAYGDDVSVCVSMRRGSEKDSAEDVLELRLTRDGAVCGLFSVNVGDIVRVTSRSSTDGQPAWSPSSEKEAESDDTYVSVQSSSWREA